MGPRRFRAPVVDGGLLAVPPLAQAPALLAENARRLADWDYDFQGRRSSPLRVWARTSAIEAARAYLTRFGLDVPAADPNLPLVVTGHQPELFHPGVWIKNFAAAGVARASGGQALNFLVDDDIPKSLSIRVPGRRDPADPYTLMTRPVRFDDGAGEIPYEDLKVADEAAFASFGTRVREALDPGIEHPLIERFWPLAAGRRGDTDRAGLRFSLARREVEASWGVRNLEVPLSTLCESEPHAWFVAHILAHLTRFRQVHNDALQAYRDAHNIRSTHHPVPALAMRGEWAEAPFWAWRTSSPRRQPLMVRSRGRVMDLRIGQEDRDLIELPLAEDRDACCAVERLMSLPALGVRVRTRALTTTMYARLLLGDLFVHGIGGAKYDELGDEVVRGFFGIEPPEYATLSLTLRLPLKLDPLGTVDTVRSLGREIRDASYNPGRSLPRPTAEESRWLASRREAIAMPQGDHAQRLARFRAIRAANQPLAERNRPRAVQLGGLRDAATDALKRNRLASSREYASVLHPFDRLAAAMGQAGGPADGKNPPAGP